ncbi:MAG: hypothetical protein K8S54_09670 [Spirochaetia bacterium]|nr:hypothetical protein [Spirochaetia bacterium]
MLTAINEDSSDSNMVPPDRLPWWVCARIQEKLAYLSAVLAMEACKLKS